MSATAQVVSLLCDISPPLLGVSKGSVQSHLTKGTPAQSQSEVQSVLHTFISDIHSRVLFYCLRAAENDNPTLLVKTGVDRKVYGSKAIAILKKSHVTNLEDDEDGIASGDAAASTPLASKIQISTFSVGEHDESTLEGLRNVLEHSFEPLLTAEANKADTESSEAGSQKDVNLLKKKLSEFVGLIQQVQQPGSGIRVTLDCDKEVIQFVEAAKREGRKAALEDIGDLINDIGFLNRLQNQVNVWSRDITQVVNQPHEVKKTNSSLEVAYWLNLEETLKSIHEQLNAPANVFQLEILNSQKRCVLFEQGTGIGRKLEEVQNVNIIMRGCPIDALFTVNRFDELVTTLRDVMNQLRKIKAATSYSSGSFCDFSVAINKDMTSQIIRLLSQFQLFDIPYREFNEVYEACRNIFQAWEEEWRKLREIVRSIIKGRATPTAFVQPFFEHVTLKERLDDIARIRRDHEDLSNALGRVFLTHGSVLATTPNDIANILKSFDDVDVVDVSPIGKEAYIATRKSYMEKLDRYEKGISSRIRDQLSHARDGQELFRMFSEYNALFFRKGIRLAIQNHQNALVAVIKKDFNTLQVKFRNGYEGSESARVTEAMSIPPAVGKLVWTRQIQQHIDLSLKRLEDVIGPQWDEYQDGITLKSEAETFKKACNFDQLLAVWVEESKTRRKFDTNSAVLMLRRLAPRRYQLSSSANAEYMLFWKELRYMGGMNWRTPFSFKSSADDARLIYPIFVSVEESLSQFRILNDKLTSDQRLRGMSPLLAAEQQNVYGILETGLNTKWDSEHSENVKNSLADTVEAMERKFGELSLTSQGIERDMRNLGALQVSASQAEYDQVLQALQKSVFKLANLGFSNLSEHVAELEANIEAVLLEHCERLVQTWTTEFQNLPVKNRSLIKSFIIYHIDIVNRVVTITPPLDSMRQIWMQSFHSCVAKVTSLSRLTLVESQQDTFRYLLEKSNQALVLAAYQALENLSVSVIGELERWSDIALVWDVDINACADMHGDDLDHWSQTITEMRQSKASVSRLPDRATIGPVVLDFSSIQQRIDQKYEQRVKEMVALFGLQIGSSVSTFFNQLNTARTALEKQGNLSAARFVTVDVNSLSGQDETTKQVATEITDYVEQLNSARKIADSWEGRVDQIGASEKILINNRFTFPEGWIYFEQISGEWDAFQSLLNTQKSFFERARPQLQNIVNVIDRKLNEAMVKAQDDWKQSKPVGGETAPAVALQVLQDTESKIHSLNQRIEKLDSAKAALGLPVGASKALISGFVDPRIIEEEVQNLKQVWSELGSFHDSLSELKNTLWASIKAKSVRETLEVLTTRVKQIPVRFRQYEAFERLQHDLKAYSGYNQLLNDLKSETLKERHWKKILDILSIRSGLQDLTLGELYDANPKAHEESLREVLTRAQGESGLSEFLATVKETWSQQTFTMVVGKSKTKLISGGDELFSLLDEHLNLLQSMKMSPYFASFEEEATAWDDKLTRLRAILDVWLDVQRKWVYLEGVFSGSADIKSLLPTEYTRFKGINDDFVHIMKKAASRPKIIDVLNQEGLQKNLTRLSEMLSKVQKALSDYLEKQRSSCPRFYFVGDEDLLEMIGNARDPATVQRHLNKMFAGIASLEIVNSPSVSASGESTDADVGPKITGMISKEQELVKFHKAIQIGRQTSLMSWLLGLEKCMIQSLAMDLGASLGELPEAVPSRKTEEPFLRWMAKYPTQIVILSIQIRWTYWIENAIANAPRGLTQFASECVELLALLADNVTKAEDKITQVKTIQLITEVVHQRDVCTALINAEVANPKDFNWLQYMRFYYDFKCTDPVQALRIKMANAEFQYGFEYLGVSERLVQTPLTDKCYMTLTQALHLRLGGNPFGPAGTGKTETVKFLGAALGRFVLVFNCDEAFDFHAMGRIFVGLCQVGAWGCFDEFNRLEERMLSAVSEQILTIQTGLREQSKEIDLLLNHSVTLSPNVGIFVTMNPGYAGRSNLPDNLKQLFREFAMIVPDKNLITEVLLYSQGFETANRLAGKVVSLFDLCLQQLSVQPHYDFGLRALKSVLSAAGQLKRKSTGSKSPSKNLHEDEQLIIIRSICDSMVPKLVQKDVPRLQFLLASVFPGASTLPVDEALLENEINLLCTSNNYEPEPSWKQKILQLYQIQKLNHGVMLVGPTGVGKTSAWSILLDALERVDGVKGASYVIDPKALSKEQLYGRLDPTTLEWTDGVFTSTVRKVVNASSSVTGSGPKFRHWIIFDGEVDPEWAENLNSVLDDNKLLTLPNGERFQIPNNVRLVFEVDSLKSATLATVSRCGMVWMSEDTLSLQSVFTHHLAELSGEPCNPVTVQQEFKRLASTLNRSQTNMGGLERASSNLPVILSEAGAEEVNMAAANTRGPVKRDFREDVYRTSETALKIRDCVATALRGFFCADGPILRCLTAAEEYFHIMTFTRIRVVQSLFSQLDQHTIKLIDYQEEMRETPLSRAAIEKYIGRSLLISVVWCLGGSMPLSGRVKFARQVATIFLACQRTYPGLVEVALPADIMNGGDESMTLLDYRVAGDGEWERWRDGVGSVELDARQVEEATLVVETTDTRSHRELIGAFLQQRRPFILCGPPGSGKTMTLLSTLKAHQSEYEICSLNFSSGTTPEMLLKTFNHYCEYVKTSGGLVLRPAAGSTKWLILFCDEINLPAPDQYGTQRVISFMRQIVTTGCFWKMNAASGAWEKVSLQRIQFAGACNPPTDAGRHPMSDRFLRHTPILFVDFPGPDSLRQIYGTFNRAMLATINMRDMAKPLTQAMVEFYAASQTNFTVDMQPHYIYSPRELSRWKLAINEAVKQPAHFTAAYLVRLAVHEAQRIFKDRLVEQSHRDWTDDNLATIFLHNFPQLSSADLQSPILFSAISTGTYTEAPIENLREHLSSKLSLFYEEEVAVKLVLFDECLQHILRIDRVLKQPLGHLLLVGVSGAGKTILSKFVAWLNGLSVFQIKAGRNYDTVAFENDLRSVMKRSGIKEEKIVFIFDESNVLGPAFLERMNALLAAGEVPGLFEQDEYTQLISECRAAFGADMEDSELFGRFTRQVQRNLHIVFTMNPANPDFYNRQATSPALFNRCVIDWFGDWSEEALVHVARDFTDVFDVPKEAYDDTETEETRRDLLARSIVSCHQAVREINEWLSRQGKKRNYVAPRDYLDFIRHLLSFFYEKRSDVTETTRHLTVGLGKLADTEAQVAELQSSLAVKEAELAEKQKMSKAKMEAMIIQRSEAEENKRQAEILAKELDEQEHYITTQKTEVQRQLNEVQPLLEEAKASVRSIPKRALEELRGMQSPPNLVRMVCESVIHLLSNSGERAVAWEDCRKALRGDFINRIVNFDATKPDSLSPATVATLKKKYLNTPEWDYSKIDNASKAAGPLSKWVSSSCSYAEIILRVEPLQKQIEELETALNTNQTKLQRTTQLIENLEQKLATLETEYRDLIAAEQQIKQDLEMVNKKVETSRTMLRNLASEQGRWQQSCNESRLSLTTEIGDNLLAAAFATYVGFFEQREREKLVAEWCTILGQNQIKYRKNLSMTEFLSKPTERYTWLGHGLPADDLSMENTVILRRFIRYPLIIDPSGQATDFILSLYADRKIVKSSFSDPGFVKQLESALRFGTALMVQDVEEMDTILNNVLNQETHKTGGRILITVGEQEIDFSPTFILFLVTRDPTVQFTPDLSSRVTLINYTTTPASLRNQCLNMLLRSERPEVDKKRRDMLKLQGEFRVKIRELEDALLNSLANVSGNILDDERVVNTLENLKRQAAEVNREVERADQVMEEVNQTIQMYIPLADAGSRLYTSLQHLSTIYFLYNYDIRFFETIFKQTLDNKPSLDSVRANDYEARAEILLTKFFKNFYDRCTLSQLHKDREVLALQFARIRFESITKVSMKSEELDLLLQGKALGGNLKSIECFVDVLEGKLSLDQRKGLQILASASRFSNLSQHLKQHERFWLDWLNSDSPEKESIPDNLCGVEANDAFLQLPHIASLKEDLRQLCCVVIEHLRIALVVRALRPDRLPSALDKLVATIMGDSFTKPPILNQDLIISLLNTDITPSVPVILVSAPGFDPSHRVVAAAQACSRSLTSIAMGSQEGYDAADKALQSASRSGGWVILKNIHLTSNKWLVNLEKSMYRTKQHERFRLFLTMEFKDKVPANLLRLAYKFVFEPPIGIKASMERSFTSFIHPPRTEKEPVTLRNRLYFFITFLHAITLERKRFAPIGWTKAYEFSDADMACSLEVVDEWIDVMGSSDPEKIPWLAIQTLLRDVMYGGRLDNELDRRVLASFVDKYFGPQMFSEAPLAHCSDGSPPLLAPPVSRHLDDYIQWLNQLPSSDHPTWIGLASHADRLLAAEMAMTLLSDWSLLINRSNEALKDLIPRNTFCGSESETEIPTVATRQASVKGIITKTLSRMASSLGGGHAADIINKLELLRRSLPPDLLPLNESRRDGPEDPIFRFFDTEVQTYNSLWLDIREQLFMVTSVATGQSKFTNLTRDIAGKLVIGEIPAQWQKSAYGGAKVLRNLDEWILDLNKRVEQLILVSKEYDGGRGPMHAEGEGLGSEATRNASLADLALLMPKGQLESLSTKRLWIGGLSNPKAYLSAAQQKVAHANKWPIDDMTMELDIGETEMEQHSFLLLGLFVNGAVWSSSAKTLKLSDSEVARLPPTRLKWSRTSEKPKSNLNQIKLPVFMTRTRQELIFYANFGIDNTKEDANLWYQRGVAFVLWWSV